ncbi:penicillin-binding protein, partial [Escherichia coli]
KLKAFRNPQPSWGFSVHKNQPGDNDPADSFSL